MLKRIILAGMFFCLMFFGSVFTFAETTKIPDPQPVNGTESFSIMGKASNGNDETPGEWYIGATPPNLKPDAPILLFVHGLNSTAQVWWEGNDMYQTAYNAGYQTTFIQLWDAGGTNEDMWDNGQLLAEKIATIYNHFGGKPITIIAHSKGGVDSQTALTYYGAHQYVDHVITLSSPHHGSQLADLAYSSWAGWLADLIGTTGDGTYSMQMAQMESYRNQTDPLPLAYYNDYYTLAGTDWGSAFSSTWYGGMYLSQYGSNDGVVTVSSSRLPGGQEIAVGDWNHNTIRTGLTFPIFDDYISDSTYFSNQLKTKKEIKSYETNQYVHGGKLKEGQQEVKISVESNVEELTLNLMTSHHPSNLTLVDPNGNIYSKAFKTVKHDDGVFVNTISHMTSIDNPMKGEWTIKVSPSQSDAYLLLADYQTSKKISINKSIKLNRGLQLTYNLRPSSAIKSNSIKATYHITNSNNPHESKTLLNNGHAKIELTQTNEVYNITINIEGETVSGETFKRTVIESVKVPGPPRKN